MKRAEELKMNCLFHLWVQAPGIGSEDWKHTWGFLSVHMSVLQTVAMVKANVFCYLPLFLESLGKNIFKLGSL